MPGICGHIGPSAREDAAATVRRMTLAMSRSALDETALHSHPTMNLAVGWTPNAVASPVSVKWNPARTVCVIIYGELFASADGPSDSDDILARLLDAYLRNGISCLADLNGWYSGLLIDLQGSKTILFNDRFGLGRVYCHESSDGFLFSSEAKSLLKVRPQSRLLDTRGVGEWLSCGCVLQNRTLFSEITLLPTGSAWIFSPEGRITKTNYFQPSTWEDQDRLDPEEYYTQLRDTFPRILRRYFSGDRPLAMSLTGGLDGRMIMAWSPRGASELPCYTFNGPIRDCADVTIARRVASDCGQPHHTIQMDDRFFRAFPALADQAISITDGAMDVTGAAELHVNALARQIAPVRITGNYGSEILRRNVAFKPRIFPDGLLNPDFARTTAAAAATYAEEAAGNRLSFIAFKQVPWHHFSRFAVERSQLTIRSPFLDNELLALTFRAPAIASTSVAPSLQLIAEGNPRLGRIPTDRGIAFGSAGVVRRANCAAQEFLTKAEYAYDYGMPDWLARVDRCVSALRLERLFLGRQKFCHFRTWYRNQLSGYVKEVLLDSRSRTRAHIGGAAIESMVSAHMAGRRNHTLEIHKLLSLELIHRTLLETA